MLYLSHGICALVAALSLSSCSLIVNLFEGDIDSGGQGVDASVGDIECEGWAIAPRAFDPCTFVEPTGSLDLRDGTWRYDTSTGTLSSPSNLSSTPTNELRAQSGGDDIRVLSVTSLRLRESATLQVVGAYPLLIVAFDDIRVGGELSIASSAEHKGAGADSGLCGDESGRGGSLEAGSGGGGGGGSLKEPGGDGGDGAEGVGGDGGDGGDGGVLLTTFRGGCPGGGGGGLTSSGGSGGGGLLLMARTEIEITGVVDAGGQGGPAAAIGATGGAGGGSGGVIAINAALVSIGGGAALVANGGGGASAATTTTGEAGEDGKISEEPALGGGTGASSGGSGGARVSGQGEAGQDGVGTTAGGGGGGGGVGEIIISARELDVEGDSLISPAYSTP